MSPAQHKAYKKNTASHADVTENMALLFEQAAIHMNAAVDAIQNKDMEKRFKESERATFILGGLKNALVHLNPEQSKTANELKSFYEGMETLIMRVNVFNSLESAQTIANSLSSMAQEWRRVGSARQVASLKEHTKGGIENIYAHA